MGLLSSLGLSAVGPSLVAGGSALLGGYLNNRAAAKEAAKQRDWQEEMSNTAYQRAVADMKAAGLNPMLSYQQGGADVPSGAVAQTSDIVTPALSTAMQHRSMMATLSNVEADTDKKEVESNNVRANTMLANAKTATEALTQKLIKEQTAQAAATAKGLEYGLSGRKTESEIDQTKYGEVLRYINRLLDGGLGSMFKSKAK